MEWFTLKFNLRKFIHTPYFAGASGLFVTNLLQNSENQSPSGTKNVIDRLKFSPVHHI